jgi:hypothetical protein
LLIRIKTAIFLKESTGFISFFCATLPGLHHGFLFYFPGAGSILAGYELLPWYFCPHQMLLADIQTPGLKCIKKSLAMEQSPAKPL